MPEIPMQPTGNTVMHQIIAQALKPIMAKLEAINVKLDALLKATKAAKEK